MQSKSLYIAEKPSVAKEFAKVLNVGGRASDGYLESADAVEKLIKDEVKKLSLRLTPYKRPVNIVVRTLPLPRTSTRKVKRKEVELRV